MPRNLETLFTSHAKRDTSGRGCFLLVQDAIRMRTGDMKAVFPLPPYLANLEAKDWVETATKRYGSLEVAWQAHLDGSMHLSRRASLSDMQPGDIAISQSGIISINGVAKRSDSIMGVISQGYELVARSNFGLATVAPIKIAWGINL